MSERREHLVGPADATVDGVKHRANTLAETLERMLQLSGKSPLPGFPSHAVKSLCNTDNDGSNRDQQPETIRPHC